MQGVGLSLESMHVAEVELVQYNEDSMNAVEKRDGAASPGSKATSGTKGHLWDWRDPVRSIGEVADGGVRRGKTGALRRSEAGDRTDS